MKNIRNQIEASLALIKKLKEENEKLKSNKSDSVAIIGSACTFPGHINSLDDLRDVLENKISVINEIPDDRWDKSLYFDKDPNAPNKMYVTRGGFIDNIFSFDALAFGVSPKEAQFIDPQQRVLLKTSWKALENANIPIGNEKYSNTGVFIGMSTYDYALEITSKTYKINEYCGTGNALSSGAGRISHVFNFSGPSITLDTACSSSLVSVHLACKSLKNNECNLALAGGVNLILSPEVMVSFCKTKMLSPDGLCKTFDEYANGYVRGEGCGIIVLKRLSDAIQDNDNILGVIKGSAINHDGKSGAFTIPFGPSQEKVIQSALDDAGIKADEVDYVECHGTGTALGDPIEVEALANVYFKNNTDKKLYLGSIKTYIGHLEAAAGIAGIFKGLVSIMNRRIYSNLNFNNPNPNIPWEHFNVKVPIVEEIWNTSNDKLRYAAVSSFGFTGTNAHLILEEYKNENSDKYDNRELSILTISSKSSRGLNKLKMAYLDYLSNKEDYSEIAGICTASALGRTHFDYRFSACGKSRKDFMELLSSDHCFKMQKNILLIFSDSNVDVFNLGCILYAKEKLFKKCVDKFNDVFITIFNSNINEILIEDRFFDFNDEQINLLVFVIEYSYAKMLIELGILPQFVQGEGVGAYVAACLTMKVNVKDALYLITKKELSFNSEEYVVNYGRNTLPMFVSNISQLILDSKEAILVELEANEELAINVSPSVTCIKIGKIVKDLNALSENCLCSFEVGKSVLKSLYDIISYSYMLGYNIDWALLYGNYTNKVKLPNYCFDDVMYRQEKRIFECFDDVSNNLNLMLNSDLFSKEEKLLLPSILNKISILGDRDSAIEKKYEIIWEKSVFDNIDENIPESYVIFSNNKKMERILKDLFSIDISFYLIPDIVDYEYLQNIFGGYFSQKINILYLLDDMNNDASFELIECVNSKLFEMSSLLFKYFSERKCLNLIYSYSIAINGIDIKDGKTYNRINLSYQSILSLFDVIKNEYSTVKVKKIETEEYTEAILYQIFYVCLKSNSENHFYISSNNISSPRLVPMSIVDKKKSYEKIYSDKLYIITGGTGYLGLHIAKWLISKGAQFLSLVSRTGKICNKQLYDEIANGSAVVSIEKIDVSDSREVGLYFDKLKTNMMPLGGIIHAAGTNSDGFVINQNRNKFNDVFSPKASGALNLFDNAKYLGFDFIINISSISSILGTPGQSNYAIANMFLNIFTYKLSAENYSCYSFNLGLLKGGLSLGRNIENLYGIDALDISEVISFIDNILYTRNSGVYYLFDFDSVDKFPLDVSIFKKDNFVRKNVELDVPKTLDESDIFNQKESVIAFLKRTFSKLVGMAECDIDINNSIINYGFDSFFAVEFKNEIHNGLQVDIDTVLLLQNPSIVFLADYIIRKNRSERKENKIVGLNDVDGMSESEIDKILGL